VLDYVDRFFQLVDQLTAYDSTTNSLHYTTRFIDGLNSDIHAVILVQRSDSLDTAYTLALLQEEAGDSSRRREFRRLDSSSTPRWNPKGAYPLPPPPGPDRPQVGAAEKPVLHPKPIDKKLADLKAYRRARGLCDHCGEKWSRDHKCAAQVGLHVLDELYALFSADVIVHSPTTEEDAEQSCCCLSA